MFVTGFAEIVDSIKAYLDRRQQNRIAFINEASEVLTQAFRRNAPKSAQSSDHAADHIRFVVDVGSTVKGKVQIDPDYKYLLFTTTGTRAHRIEGQPLRFFVKGGTMPHFAMFVNHPGTKPNDWMERARGEAYPIIESLREKHGV
jgi:hypothetical protein